MALHPYCLKSVSISGGLVKNVNYLYLRLNIETVKSTLQTLYLPYQLQQILTVVLN